MSSARFREINATPLVDVMLVLLAVCMITAPLLPASLAVELPRVAGTSGGATDREVEMVIDREGRIHVDGRDASDDPRAAVAAQLHAGSERVVVRADTDVRYGVVARAVAAARDAGASAIDLLVDPNDAP
ncbi:MAG TPA: biopolymer transporter ExbD [Nannocystaceae bacterium]|nr:biopolymer transporter ExbD [Nannocystaceae bacterium]